MSQFESEAANEIKYQLALRDQQITALKLAATEQATQAEAVLKERTRERDQAQKVCNDNYDWAKRVEAERDALALSQGRLLGMLRDWRMNLYPRDHAKYCRASVKYPDWPDPKDDRCDLCKRTDAAIAEATPQETNEPPTKKN